jgi:hypothetical protein
MVTTLEKDIAVAESAKDKVGFALGGLGGFNAYGVGFLQAARQLKVRPDIITCTSGMIAWVAKWLDGKDLYGEDLEPLIMAQIQKDTRFPPSLDWLNTLSVSAWFGSSGIFRPALLEYLARWLTPMTPREELAEQVLDRLFPAQVYVPLRGHEDLEHIAYVLNKSLIPVAFNTIHPKSGRTYLHINQAAKEFLEVKLEEIGEVGGPQKYTWITTETVGGALWVFFYGSENDMQHRLNPLGLVDGAYNRQFIISELHKCDRIYAVRPLNTKWLDHPPLNYLDNEVFKDWMWINSAYATEIAGMETINNLIQRHHLTHPDYKMVELIEVQIPLHYGPFQQLHEQKGVYELAFNEAMSKLQEHEMAVAC